MTMASPQEHEEQLEYAARLSGLLLNEATDVMRWFMLDNLPRSVHGSANLNELLQEHRKVFTSLRDDRIKHSGTIVFGHEMFDILFPPYGMPMDEENLEISLIFVIIRCMCKIKHPDWKWWDEDPQPHHTTPVFDVIRLARFKHKMNRIVHEYEINEKTYTASLAYLTEVIGRLRGYKISTRRWKGDVIAYQDDESVTKQRKTINLVAIMRWQTLPVEYRDATYLVMKKNLLNKIGEAEGNPSAWEAFASCFGQMKFFNICEANDLKVEDTERTLLHPANDLSHRDYLEAMTSPAKYLNWDLVQDGNWKKGLRAMCEPSLKNQSQLHETEYKPVLTSSLTAMERRIYESVDDTVFIKNEDSEQYSQCLSSIREKWKEKVIVQNSHIHTFPWRESDTIHLDDVTIRLGRDDQKKTPLESWAEILCDLQGGAPLRVVIDGKPSSGKTTVLRKLLYDLATNNRPENHASDLVFHIDLATILKEKPYTRIADCILRQCLESDESVTADQLEGIIKSRNGKGILFLFDNADQMEETDEMSEIYDVIKSFMWSECGIILTVSNEIFVNQRGRNFCVKTLPDSKFPWKIYHTLGFSDHDVINEVRRVFRNATGVRGITEASISRHVTNLIRVFQRDIYSGEESTPMLVTILCHAWKVFSNKATRKELEVSKARQQFPETMGKVLKEMIYSSFQSENFSSSFFGSVLKGTLADPPVKLFQIEPDSDDQVDALLKCGVLLRAEPAEHSPQENSVHFAHPMLQSYFAARVYCSGDDTDNFLRHMTSLGNVLRIRDFLIFCCEENACVAEEILGALGCLAKEFGQPPDNITSQEEQKAAFLRLCLQCFYVSTLRRDSKCHGDVTNVLKAMSNPFHKKDFDDADGYSEIATDIISTNLVLGEMHKMSNRMKQSLLAFVRACRPPLTQSGTVFPSQSNGDTRETSSIRKLIVTDLRAGQAHFVASIISSLPFLEEVHLMDIGDINDDDFATLCSSLKPAGEKLTAALHCLTIFFQRATRFDTGRVSTLQPLANVLPHLPYLETLDINPLTYEHFVSLYSPATNNNNIVVPMKNALLRKSGISESQCCDMARFIRRSFFLHSLDLSQNPIHGGLAGYQEAFASLRFLKELNLQECCLSSTSIFTLSSAMSGSNFANTLTSLNLRGNHLDHEAALVSIANAIHRLPSLLKLDLSLNFLRNRVICVLAAGLPKLPRLRELRLDYVQMGDLGFSALRCNIHHLQGLEVLSLGENTLGSSSLESLSELCGEDVASRKTLREIKISGISDEIALKISKKSVQILAECLNRFTQLQILDMRHTTMKYSDIVLLLHSAEGHATLREVRLSDSLNPLKEAERKTWKCLEVA